MPPLILASTSRYRKELLERLGLPFQAVAPGVDEEAVKAEGLAPRRVAEVLAERKAAAVATRHPGAVVIGSDQLVADGARILGKAGSRAAAEAQLRSLRGRSHELVTAVHVIHPGGTERRLAIATLAMRELSDAAIARYVAADDPVDCAGSYKLERRGIALFRDIACDDHSTIVGLPLIWLSGVLAELGYETP